MQVYVLDSQYKHQYSGKWQRTTTSTTKTQEDSREANDCGVAVAVALPSTIIDFDEFFGSELTTGTDR